MFTGIVEEVGKISEFHKSSQGAKIVVECKTVLENLHLGDSVAVDGCCQTVVEIADNSFSAELSPETLKMTTFALAKVGGEVNLERALTPTSRLGGHIVQGHVDCLGKFLRSEKFDSFYELTFELPQTESKYIVNKGSVAINGVSLTVARVSGNIFTVAVIPHTRENTTLKNLPVGDTVNIETDILGRYVEKFLSTGNNENSRISVEFLAENGFM